MRSSVDPHANSVSSAARTASVIWVVETAATPGYVSKRLAEDAIRALPVTAGGGREMATVPLIIRNRLS